MPNIAKALKEETVRISRKEIRSLMTKPLKTLVSLRREVSELKKRLALLEKNSKEFHAAAVPQGAPEAEESGTSRVWFTSKGIRSLRKKLKVSQAKFAELVGVSAQAVYNWERQKDREKLTLRSKTLDALMKIRGIGLKEVTARLDAAPKAPAVRPARRVAKARRGIRKGGRHAS